VSGQVSWLRANSSQWRDRAGISPASLFSPINWGTQTQFEKSNRNVAATLTRQTKGVKEMTDEVAFVLRPSVFGL